MNDVITKIKGILIYNNGIPIMQLKVTLIINWK